MLLGSSCSGDDIHKLELYNPYPGSLHSVPGMATVEGGVQTLGPDRSSVPDQNGFSTVPIITYETPEDTTGILLHCEWETDGTDRYFRINKGQALPFGLGIRHDASGQTLSEKDLNRWTRADRVYLCTKNQKSTFRTRASTSLEISCD